VLINLLPLFARKEADPMIQRLRKNYDIETLFYLTNFAAAFLLGKGKATPLQARL